MYHYARYRWIGQRRSIRGERGVYQNTDRDDQHFFQHRQRGKRAFTYTYSKRILNMKKAILFSVLVFSALLIKAQGNLQFNQIILYDLAGSAIQNITVPPGKVWKI